VQAVIRNSDKTKCKRCKGITKVSTVQEFNSSRVQKVQEFKVQEFNSSRVQKFRSSIVKGSREFNSSRVQKFRSSKVQEFIQ
jgi:hypothetical protein